MAADTTAAAVLTINSNNNNDEDNKDKDNKRMNSNTNIRLHLQRVVTYKRVRQVLFCKKGSGRHSSILWATLLHPQRMHSKREPPLTLQVRKYVNKTQNAKIQKKMYKKSMQANKMHINTTQ